MKDIMINFVPSRIAPRLQSSYDLISHRPSRAGTWGGKWGLVMEERWTVGEGESLGQRGRRGLVLKRLGWLKIISYWREYGAIEGNKSCRHVEGNGLERWGKGRGRDCVICVVKLVFYRILVSNSSKPLNFLLNLIVYIISDITSSWWAIWCIGILLFVFHSWWILRWGPQQVFHQWRGNFTYCSR